MTFEETKKELHAVRDIRDDMIRIEDMIRQVRMNLMPSGIRYDTDPVQTSPEDRLLKDMARLDELEREWKDRRMHLVEEQNRIEQRIDMLEEAQDRLVLHLRYVAMYEWDKAAEMMNMTTRNAYRVRDRAVENYRIMREQSCH